MILKLTNNLTKAEFLIPIQNEKEVNSRIFFCFEINLPENMDDGEYNYSLLDEKGAELASGLLQIGDYVAEKKEYNNENDKEYITYDGE